MFLGLVLGTELFLSLKCLVSESSCGAFTSLCLGHNIICEFWCHLISFMVFASQSTFLWTYIYLVLLFHHISDSWHLELILAKKKRKPGKGHFFPAFPKVRTCLYQHNDLTCTCNRMNTIPSQSFWATYSVPFFLIFVKLLYVFDSWLPWFSRKFTHNYLLALDW